MIQTFTNQFTAKDCEDITRLILNNRNWLDEKPMTDRGRSWTHMLPKQPIDELQHIVNACELALMRAAGVDRLPGKDQFFIYYNVGDVVETHLDKAAPGSEHWRCNLVLQQAEVGGILTMGEKEVELCAGDMYVFRPDLVSHGVSAIEKGSRLVWTTGCAYVKRQEPQ